MTYTYAIMDVSEATYNEIATKMREAGYDHAFERGHGRSVIDMHGIALAVEETKAAPLPPYVVAYDPTLPGGDEAVAMVMRVNDNKVLGYFDPTGMSQEQMEARALEIARKGTHA